MVRLMLALVVLAGPAGAGCFEPAMPKTVRFQDGRTAQVLSLPVRM